MRWSQVIADPSLRDLPYKVELNEWGNVVLSPASNTHGLLQAELSWLLRERRGTGRVIVECSIETAKGVKVADVAWGSREFFDCNELETPYRQAPELCIEILSPSNASQEMIEKIGLYLDKGAREVWLCGEDGRIEIFTSAGQVAQSQLFPTAPTEIHY